MMGLIVVCFFAIYLLVSIWVTKKAASWAKVNNKKPWLWGGLAAFVMYNLVFWDWIPTLVMHKYYCATQAGFWVYKTPEQWKKENSEAQVRVNSAQDYYKGTDNNHESVEILSQHLVYVRKLNPALRLLPVYKTEEYIEDSDNRQILVKRKNYLSGYRERHGLGQLKVWMGRGNCDEENITLLAFGKVEEKFRKLSGGE